jgi:hypothetical protein
MSTPLIFQQENAPTQDGGNKPLIFGGTPKPIIFNPQPTQQVQLEDNRSWLQKGIGAIGTTLNKATETIKKNINLGEPIDFKSVNTLTQPNVAYEAPKIVDQPYATHLPVGIVNFLDTLNTPSRKISEFAVNTVKSAVQSAYNLGATSGNAVLGGANKRYFTPQEQQVLGEQGYFDKSGNVRTDKYLIDLAKTIVNVAPFTKGFGTLLEKSGVPLVKVLSKIPLVRDAITDSGAINIFGRAVSLSRPIGAAGYGGTAGLVNTKDLENIGADKEVQKNAIVNTLLGMGFAGLMELGFEYFRSPYTVNQSSNNFKSLDQVYKELSRVYHPNSTFDGKVNNPDIWLKINKIRASYTTGEINYEQALKQFNSIKGGVTANVRQPYVAQPEARQLPSSQESKVPAKGTIEQITEQKGGWNPGDRVRFDTAMLEKDAQTVKQMLPVVPKEYQQRFSKEIASLVGETPVTPRARENLKLPNPPEGAVGSGVSIRPDGTASFNVEVAEGMRGKGVGTEIVKQQEALALSKGVDKVVLDVKEESVGFFAKLGYTKVGEVVRGLQVMTKNITTAKESAVTTQEVKKEPAQPVVETKTPQEPSNKVEKVSTPPEPVKVPKEQLPVGEGDKKVSRLSERMSEALSNITKEEIDALPTYNQMNKDVQKSKAAKYVTDNPEEAMRVLKGEIDPPDGLLYNSVFLGMQESARSGDNISLIKDLASLRSTRYGQEIGILTEADPNNPVNILQTIRKSRIEVLEKRYKQTIEKVSQKTVRQIKEKIKVPSKADWKSFIDSIEC